MPFRFAPVRLLSAPALLLALALQLASATPTAWGNPADPVPAADRETIERQIEERSAAEEAARAEEAALRAEFESLQAESVEAARQYETLDRAILLLDLQQALAGTELARRAESLDAEAARLSGVLNGLLRLSQRPALPLPFLDLSVNDQARAARALSFTTDALLRRTAAIRLELEALAVRRDQLGEDRRLLQAKRAELDDRKQQLDALSARKEELVQQAAVRRGGIEAQLTDLARRSRDLAELTQKLQEEAAAEAQALAAAVARAREARAQAARTQAARAGEASSAPSRPSPPATAAAPAVASDPAAVPEAAPDATPDAGSGGTDPRPTVTAGLRPTSVRTFPSRPTGQLQRPLAGQLLSGFGDAASTRGRDQGLLFSAKRGALVVAPFDGQVVYAGPFRHYGLLLIIDHGGQYHSLLAGFGRLAVTSGQWVLAGEPIGWMSDLKSGQPELYLELRRSGSPIDPLPWLSPASDTTRG